MTFSVQSHFNRSSLFCLKLDIFTQIGLSQHPRFQFYVHVNFAVAVKKLAKKINNCEEHYDMQSRKVNAWGKKNIQNLYLEYMPVHSYCPYGNQCRLARNILYKP
jgi:hypothetical protein